MCSSPSEEPLPAVNPQEGLGWTKQPQQRFPDTPCTLGPWLRFLDSDPNTAAGRSSAPQEQLSGQPAPDLIPALPTLHQPSWKAPHCVLIPWVQESEHSVPPEKWSHLHPSQVHSLGKTGLMVVMLWQPAEEEPSSSIKLIPHTPTLRTFPAIANREFKAFHHHHHQAQ